MRLPARAIGRLAADRGRLLDVTGTLVREADVVVENFRPGVAKRLGVDYETLKELVPGLIYASISGFGQTGPYANYPGYDLIAQGMTGVMSITGEADGRILGFSSSLAEMKLIPGRRSPRS